jgi:hypothetical protein
MLALKRAEEAANTMLSEIGLPECDVAHTIEPR